MIARLRHNLLRETVARALTMVALMAGVALVASHGAGVGYGSPAPSSTAPGR